MDLLTVVLAVLLALLVGVFAGFRIARSGAGSTERLQQENARLGAELAAAESARSLLIERVNDLEDRAQENADVLTALAPVKAHLVTMEKSVRDMETQRAQQFGSVAEALKISAQTQESLRNATGSLAGALRSSSARGTWGEAQLKRVVEAAGMNPHVAYSEQVAAHTTNAQGKESSTRPDMVVYLPGGKSIVLDAKAPLAAYLSAQDAAEENQKKSHLTQHAKAVKSHVDALAHKKYWNGFTATPELVLCFIPVESALAAALTADPTLLDYAASKNVALVSPVSLLASLKAIAFSWRQDALTDNARELFGLSTQLYERLGSAGSHLSAMGRQLTRTVESYNGLVGSLENRVFVTARKIADLDGASLGTENLSPTVIEPTPKPLTASEFLETTNSSNTEQRATAPGATIEAEQHPDTEEPTDDSLAAFEQYRQAYRATTTANAPAPFEDVPLWETEVDQEYEERRQADVRRSDHEDDQDPAIILERQQYGDPENDSPFDYDSWNS